MSDIRIFSNPQFGEIRTAGTKEEPKFCLADVCKALGLSSNHVRERLGDGVVSTDTIVDSLGREQLANFVNEDGLYDVILDSRKPEAKVFRKWITSEVLPSIRKTGGYIAFNQNMTDEEIMARAIMVAQATIQKREQEIKLLSEQNNQLALENQQLKKDHDYFDKILSSKATMTTTQIAQDYGMSAKAFNKILKDLHIQYKINKQWILYAPYISQGYVQSRTIEITRSNGMPDVVMNTSWTQKGRIFLYNKLKDNNIIPLIEQ